MSVAIAILACLVAVGFYIEMKIRTNRARAEVKRMQGLIDSPMLVRNTPVGIEQRYPYFDTTRQVLVLSRDATMPLEDWARVIIYLHKTYNEYDWALLNNILRNEGSPGMSIGALNEIIRSVYAQHLEAAKHFDTPTDKPDWGTPE